MDQMQTVFEFVGGPLDGHRQPFNKPMDEMANNVVIPINENVFRMLDGRPRGPAVPSSRVAFYERKFKNGECQFVFLGECPSAAFSAENWSV